MRRRIPQVTPTTPGAPGAAAPESAPARMRPTRQDPFRVASQAASEAAERQPRAIGRRWTLVDGFVRDGRLFVLAVDNREGASGLDLLSPREREVVLSALHGKLNKLIAFEMGLAQSTVRVLIARAAAKLGVSSRAALLRKAAELGLQPRGE
ncbi:MAG TPA: helix-turn-helix transcriptional regulator [Polyangiaceae bacterium]|nr:helix-turn-helix transcriptional regulator [Polyangiaceae bacterium]